MARPSKQTVDYFPHLAKSGKTLYILENTYGNDGYAFWFKLLEILASSEGHFYDCNSAYNWDYLVAYTRVGGEKATEILNKLSELEAIDKELWRGKILWVQHLVDNVEDVYKTRKAAVPQRPIMNQKIDSTINPTGQEFSIRKPEQSEVSSRINSQSKVEETKEEESKAEEEEKRGNDDSSAAASTEFSEIIDVFNNNIHPVTPIEAEKLGDWLKDVEPGVVILAIHEAVKYSKRSLGYINAVLSSWFSNNIKTQEAAEAYLRDRDDEKKKGEQGKQGKNYKAPVTTFNSYDQRKYDINELERKLLGRDGPGEDVGG
jgi:DnaD/phage-associated family protein